MIENILQPNQIVSAILLLVCLYIKSTIGEEWKQKWEYDDMYKFIRICSEFSIDIIPIMGYPLILLISNTSKVLISTVIMIAIILVEAKIKKRNLSLLGDKLKGQKWYAYLKVVILLLSQFTLSTMLCYGIYLFAITDILK